MDHERRNNGQIVAPSVTTPLNWPLLPQISEEVRRRITAMIEFSLRCWTWVDDARDKRCHWCGKQL